MDLKIGEFARLGQVSVQTLRYYDELGLIKPCRVDPLTGYRYYALEQLPCLIRILAFKDLGIPLEQITHLLAENISLPDLRTTLIIRREELNKQVQGQLEQLERINARLQLIEQENINPSYEVILKRVDPLKVASIRRIVPSYWDAGPLWSELFTLLGQHNLTPDAPCFTLCHANEQEIDIEVCAPLPPDTNSKKGLSIWNLPEVKTMACTIHHGPFTGLITGFTALIKWIDTNNYTITGPDREIYLRLPEACQFHHDPDAITELQIPVKKK